MASWKTIFDISKGIYDGLKAAYKPAFFELVHHPVAASYNLAQLYIAAGKNNLYASQARLSTNDLADTVRVFPFNFTICTEHNGIHRSRSYLRVITI